MFVREPPEAPMLASDMPALFTREDVAKIAALANLELDSAEMDLFARQLGEFLSYAAVSYTHLTLPTILRV